MKTRVALAALLLIFYHDGLASAALLRTSTSTAVHRILQQRDTLVTELLAWKNSAQASDAKQLGVYTEEISMQDEESASPFTEDELWRFASTKVAVAELSEQHPHATFSSNTPFALMTREEFKAFVDRSGYNSTSAMINAMGASVTTSTTSLPPVPRSNATRTRRLHGSFTPGSPSGTPGILSDWDGPNWKCVTPAKNQGSCGSCAYFAAVAAIETFECVYGSPTFQVTDYSEQYTVSCMPDQGGCAWGTRPDKVMEWVRQRGICKSAEYPYRSGLSTTDGECQADKCTRVNQRYLSVGTVDASEAALQEVVTRFPVTVPIAGGSPALQHYAGGVLEGCEAGENINHAMMVTGYGVDGIPYWKLKNSWGSSYGEKGFVRIRRGVGGAGACKIVGDYGFYPSILGI